jgi:hypothetical protein
VFSSNVAALKLPSQTLASLNPRIDCIWASCYHVWTTPSPLLELPNHHDACVLNLNLCWQLSTHGPTDQLPWHSPPQRSLPCLIFMSHYCNDETSNHLNISFIQPVWSDQ